MIATPQRSYKNIGARWLRNRGWSPAANSGDNAPGHSSNQTNMETNPPVGVATSHGQGILHKNGKNHAMINDMMEGDLEGDFASNKDGEVNVSKNGNNKEKGIVIGGNSEVTIYDNKKRKVGDEDCVGHDVISDVLNDRDQQLVWRIPLWYWVKDSKGMFSVKSAYRHQQEAHGHINLNVPTDMWKRLWNLKVPPKVLNFLWRVSANCLPTRFLLALRHVQVDSLCPFCSAAPETALHVLVRCNFAKLCWQQAKVPTVAPAAMFFRSWFEEGLSKWNEVESIEAAMTLWALWKVRNDVVWNSISPTSEELKSTTLSKYINDVFFLESCSLEVLVCIAGPSNGFAMKIIKVNCYPRLEN
ncbi:hypothetical protein F8388_002962 [Cannabis sativa]|uniref:Reverse transcriptase zinc-binding domain-containing protein n=1 Tax=Cannabis sativa TaxID=3483 RepID=A0A7J6H640_CANSA|nr:hypothetical protein F8388_002962 [Cannabis sativa]